MYDLRLCLLYSYIAYSFFLPGVFIFLLFIYKTFSSFLILVIIIDTILFLTLLGALFWFRAEKQQHWFYIILIIAIILITMRNLYLFISVIYRTATEFEKKRAIFFDAINRQINLLQEPQHPVWQIILLKQCCGLKSKFSKATIEEYRWFTQTPFANFCPGLHLKQDQIIQFEQTFKMKYSPQGFCLPLVINDLKIELILISIGFGFGVLLMLLTWLFIWQYRLSYITSFKNMLKKQKKKSITNTNKTSITSTIQESEAPQVLNTPALEKTSPIVAAKPSETKRLFKGYLSPLEDVE